jgi:predicted transcriptional regulator
MKQSRLELYIEILKVLNQKHSKQNSTSFSDYKIDQKNMRERMNFLMQQCLITKKINGKQVFYENTEKGKNVLRFFNEFDNRAFMVEVSIGVANSKNTY